MLNLNRYCLLYVFVLFLDLLERVAEWFQKEELTFKHHVLIIKYIGKRKREKSTCLLTGQGKASLQMEWKENCFVYVEKGGKQIAPIEIPA